MDYSNTLLQILLFLIFILVLLFINKYFFNTENNITVTNANTNNTYNTNKAYNIDSTNNKVRCIEEKDPLINNNKNDLKIVNNKFNIYDEYTNTNDEFVNELLPNYKEYKIPSNELDMHFINNNIIYDSEKDKGKCYIKEEKTDLPIANINICNLTNTRLSEYI